jgi:hypothetical protein
MRRYLILIGLLVAVFAAGGVLAGDAEAVESGDVVVVLIPIDSLQPVPPVRPNDRLIIRGGPTTTTDTTGCETGTYPVQDATLVDTSGRPGGIEGLVTISQSDPLPPGTRLINLSEVSPSPCTTNTTTYRRYEGIVE